MKFSIVLVGMALLAFQASISLGMSLGQGNNDDSEVDEADLLGLINQNRLEKRGKFDPSDPRSLFNAVYSNYK